MYSVLDSESGLGAQRIGFAACVDLGHAALDGKRTVESVDAGIFTFGDLNGT